MEPYQKRVVVEKAELDEKMYALELFIGSAVFIGIDEVEQSRLNRQVGAMDAYSQILRERIAAF